MTITAGRRLTARSTASGPSPASPTTVIPGSSSSMRRKPRRTSTWSSTTIVAITPSGLADGIRLLPERRNGETHQGAALGAGQKFHAASRYLRAFAHGDEAEPILPPDGKPGAVILDFQDQPFIRQGHPQLHLLRAGMARHIVERLLKHTVEMNALFAAQSPRLGGPDAAYGDSGPPFENRKVRVNRALHARFFQHHRVQGLREGAHLFESGLHDLVDFANFRAHGRRVGRGEAARALEHGADSGQDLAELVVQFARDRTERVLLHRNQLLGQFAAA